MINKIKREWRLLNTFINVKLAIFYIVVIGLVLTFWIYLAYLVIMALRKYIGG